MSAPARSQLLGGIAALLALGGCATFENGSDDSVPVVTDPPGASVVSSNGVTCVSPCRVTGSRKDTFVLTIAKPGFVTQTVESDSVPMADFEEASRNEPTADYLGRLIDVRDGSHNQHLPAAVVVKLVPVK